MKSSLDQSDGSYTQGLSSDISDENAILTDYVILEHEALSTPLESIRSLDDNTSIISQSNELSISLPINDAYQIAEDEIRDTGHYTDDWLINPHLKDANRREDNDNNSIALQSSELGINRHFSALEVKKYEALGMAEQAVKCPMSNEECSVLSRFFLRLMICFLPYVRSLFSCTSVC
jgi:hypothetical protein